MSRAVLPILRHMARSGGTLLSRCVGCMEGVALLSEIHPLGLRVFDPAKQAAAWFGLATPGEAAAWGAQKKPIDWVLCELSRRARERGRVLVVREWTHLDVIGHPFVRATGRFALGEAVARRMEPAAVFTCRHPLDQWLSLSRLAVSRGLTLEAYLRGCAVFAEWAAAGGGAVKFEDFCAEPARWLGELCGRLGVAYDAGWETKWRAYRTITGDDPRGDTRGEEAIRVLPRREAPAGLIERMRAQADYRRACELLGYEA